LHDVRDHQARTELLGEACGMTERDASAGRAVDPADD
jgi:hypothetical protein